MLFMFYSHIIRVINRVLRPSDVEVSSKEEQSEEEEEQEESDSPIPKCVLLRALF
jgi:hypothetical protein